MVLIAWATLAHAINIQIDYSVDAANGNFFGTNPIAKATMDAAAQDVGNAITGSLGSVPTSSFLAANGSTTAKFDWRLDVTNPSTGGTFVVSPFTLPPNTVTIYVSVRTLPGNPELGVGGPSGAGITLAGSGIGGEWVGAVTAAQNASNATMSRGGPIMGTLSGSSTLSSFTANYGLNYGALAGTVSLSATATWHYDYRTPVGAGENDFYSVALHEILHALGFGSSATWNSLRQGTTWTGPNVIALKGTGANLLSADGGHIADGTMSARITDGAAQEAALDPSITAGTRKSLTLLDLAFLRDIGYTTVSGPSSPTVTTFAASSLAFNSATVNGSVNPNGPATTFHFDYGLTDAYGDSTPDQNAGSGTSPLAGMATLSGLTPSTTYHFRIAATNNRGTIYGGDLTFITPDSGNMYFVVANSSSASGGSVSGGGTVSSGSSVTVTASPFPGRTFVNWTEGGNPVSGAGLRYTFAANSNRTLVANFRVSGDFNGDGTPDLVLQYPGGYLGAWCPDSAGALKLWISLNSGASFGAWSVVGVGDFNADGILDLVLQYPGGYLGAWCPDGTGAFKQWIPLNNGASFGAWSVVGAGDFNADGILDIILQYPGGYLGAWCPDNTGAFKLWIPLNNGNSFGAWSVAGVGDFNADGILDIILQYPGGYLGAWCPDNTGAFKQWIPLNNGASFGTWSVAGTGDFNADGIIDIILQYPGGYLGAWCPNSTGAFKQWIPLNNGGSFAPWTVVR